MVTLINIYKELGLTASEVKAYEALLELGETKANRVAITSQIPRAKVYGVLESLSNKGWVNSHGDPQLFKAVPPKVIMRKLLDNKISLLEEVGSRFIGEQQHFLDMVNKERGKIPEPLYGVDGDDAIFAEMQKMIATLWA